MVEMLNWKEALEHLTDNKFYVNDEYLTGNLEINQDESQEMYDYPNMTILLGSDGDKRDINSKYYDDYQLDINEVLNDYKTFVSNPNHIMIKFTVSDFHRYFGMNFTNVYLNNGNYIDDDNKQYNLTANISCRYIYEGNTYNYSDINYYFFIPNNFFGKTNQYIDFNYLNTHVVKNSVIGLGNYIIPEGAVVISSSINSIEFTLIENKYTGYLDFYSPDGDKIRLSTNRLFDSIYNVNNTARFTEETDELTRRLISKGVLADALFAEEVKCKNRWSQIFNKISETQDEYSKLIKIQQDNIATITDAIKNVTTIKFNDTPQTSNDFTGNEFNSTITTTESEVQLGSLADKLEIAKKALSDIYDSWIANFKTFYIY